MTDAEIASAVELQKRLIPQGTQVASKGWFRWCEGFGPRFIVSAEDANITDEKERTYIDWTMGLGAITIGHGISVCEVPPGCFPVPTIMEGRLADTVNRLVPCAEKMRFLKTGTDATSACVRLARVFTGRHQIVTCGSYHGWADWSLAPEKEGVPSGVRAYTSRVPYNDAEALAHVLKQERPACVILEPVSLVKPKPGYLQEIRKLCDQHGVVLIFDEVITGFRMHPGGAQAHYGIKPDLCAMGKAMANGWPISLCAGRADIMDCWERTHISGTYYADPVPMAAATTTLSALAERRFWDHQANIGCQMLNGTARMIDRLGLHNECTAIGHPHWWALQIHRDEYQTLWQQEVLRRGIMSSGSHFVCLAHTQEHVDATLDAYQAALEILKDAIGKGDVNTRLECSVNRTVFNRAQ